MKAIDILAEGHIAAAKEKGLLLTRKEAENIAIWEKLHCEVVIDEEHRAYGVAMHNKSILGDVYYLTKLYVPEEYRGRGVASMILNRLPAPLLKAESMTKVR